MGGSICHSFSFPELTIYAHGRISNFFGDYQERKYMKENEQNIFTD